MFPVCAIISNNIPDFPSPFLNFLSSHLPHVSLVLLCVPQYPVPVRFPVYSRFPVFPAKEIFTSRIDFLLFPELKCWLWISKSGSSDIFVIIIIIIIHDVIEMTVQFFFLYPVFTLKIFHHTFFGWIFKLLFSH